MHPKVSEDKQNAEGSPQMKGDRQRHQNQPPIVAPWHWPFQLQQHELVQALNARDPDATKRGKWVAGALLTKNSKMKSAVRPELVDKTTENGRTENSSRVQNSMESNCENGIGKTLRQANNECSQFLVSPTIPFSHPFATGLSGHLLATGHCQTRMCACNLSNFQEQFFLNSHKCRHANVLNEYHDKNALHCSQCAMNAKYVEEMITGESTHRCRIRTLSTWTCFSCTPRHIQRIRSPQIRDEREVPSPEQHEGGKWRAQHEARARCE